MSTLLYLKIALMAVFLMIQTQPLYSVKRQVTCDFDLENIEVIVQYLPEVCRIIYQNRRYERQLYNMYTAESKDFKIFHERLTRYELRYLKWTPKAVYKHLDTWPFEEWLRMQLYKSANLPQCERPSTHRRSEIREFLNCLKVARSNMIDAIPEIY